MRWRVRKPHAERRTETAGLGEAVRHAACREPARLAVALGGVLLLAGLGWLIRRGAAEPPSSTASDWLDPPIESPEPREPRPQAAP